MSLAHREIGSLFRSERREYRLLYCVTFPLSLAVAASARVLPERLRPLPVSGGSYFAVLRDARAAAHSVLPYAFMR